MAESSFQKAFTNMQELYGTDGCRDILESFVDESRKLMDQIKQATSGQDSKECGRLAHQFKGLASLVTHDEMVTTSLALEKSANEHNWQDGQKLLAELDGQLNKLLADINQCLS